MQKGDEAVTDFNGKGVVRVAITDRREHAQSQSRVMYRVWPPLKGGNNETWYDAANVANYANREATKTVTPRLKWSFDGATISWVGKTLVDRSKSLKVN